MKHFAKTDRLALLASTSLTAMARADVTPEAVIMHYADVAEAKIRGLPDNRQGSGCPPLRHSLADPTEEKLEAARTAWLAARVPYQQSEVYRFGNAIVDDWEGRVNAWPLDERA